mmetsp:Transcript_6051/g.14654  ORF Transcript_6051/g.14654 Transcript_6051/m.14654 type:complete len:200 (-) Transcript_6051:165-764(-)
MVPERPSSDHRDGHETKQQVQGALRPRQPRPAILSAGDRLWHRGGRGHRSDAGDRFRTRGAPRPQPRRRDAEPLEPRHARAHRGGRGRARRQAPGPVAGRRGRGAPRGRARRLRGAALHLRRHRAGGALARLCGARLALRRAGEAGQVCRGGREGARHQLEQQPRRPARAVADLGDELQVEAARAPQVGSQLRGEAGGC